MKDSWEGKKILITGSTDGLGKLMARHLAMHNAEVLLHGRNESKGNKVLDEINALCPDCSLKYYNADYSSLQEVNSLSLKILEEHDHLDVLINNVGIGRGLPTNNHRELSKEGIELRFAVNYLAHVLLTEKLLPILKPPTSHIINVASVGQAPLDFDNLMLDHHYDGLLAYHRSKAAMIMYTFDLAERLKEIRNKSQCSPPGFPDEHKNGS